MEAKKLFDWKQLTDSQKEDLSMLAKENCYQIKDGSKVIAITNEKINETFVYFNPSMTKYTGIVVTVKPWSTNTYKLSGTKQPYESEWVWHKSWLIPVEIVEEYFNGAQPHGDPKELFALLD